MHVNECMYVLYVCIYLQIFDVAYIGEVYATSYIYIWFGLIHYSAFSAATAM